jgi:hypothetical protein
MKDKDEISLKKCWGIASCCTILALGLPVLAGSSTIPLPDKVRPAIEDLQAFQSPDHVHLTGWIGTRIQANEAERLAKLDPARLLEGYRKRPGRQIWDGEHVGKWLHAATLAWVNTGDAALRTKLDYTAAELMKCQLEDGYLGTYAESERWTLWDVWAHKYNLIGLITYMRYTGNVEPLPACRRMADLLCRTFGDEPGKRDIILAGQHMGMAPTSVLEPMVLLYLQMQGKKPYGSTLDGHCCLSSGPRGISLIPTFAVSADDDGVVFNLYEQGTAKLKFRDGTVVGLSTETKYPSDELIRITLSPESAASFALKLRIPAWCQNPGLRVNGKETNAERGQDGYAAVRRQWKPGDQIELRFKLEPRVVVGDHKNEGRIAVLYGPLVLAADEALLEGSQAAFNSIGVPAPELSALNFTPEPAAGPFKTWPGAEVFRINAVVNPGSPQASASAGAHLRLVPFADAGASGAAYKIWLPYEPPRPSRNLLMDGLEIRSRKPNAGSIIDDNLHTIASTFSNKRAPQDWFGVELEAPITIGRIVFAHGQTFHDGGWFDAAAGKPRVEIKTSTNAPWAQLCELKDYPATTATDPAGLKGGEQFTCVLSQPAQIVGLRVVGKPACGDNPKQAFSSCAELQAFAPAPEIRTP